MATAYKRTKRRDEKFFKALSEGCGVTRSAACAGYSRRAVYYYRDDDQEFAERWEDAIQKHIEVLETEADRRAVEGVEEPVYYQGAECGRVKKFSDTLLMFRLKKLDPSYRERFDLTHTGEIKNTAPVVNLSFTGSGSD